MNFKTKKLNLPNNLFFTDFCRTEIFVKLQYFTKKEEFEISTKKYFYFLTFFCSICHLKILKYGLNS